MEQRECVTLASQQFFSPADLFTRQINWQQIFRKRVLYSHGYCRLNPANLNPTLTQQCVYGSAQVWEAASHE